MLQVFDFLGVAVFAVTGAIVASRLKLDILAFVFFASFTGIGGGTLRDLLLGVPIFWVEDQTYLIVCIAVGIAIWFSADRIEKLGKPLRWADAVGISAYCVMGAAKTLSAGDVPVVAVMMGITTATFGGIIRDTIAGQPTAIARSEIYLTAAFAGATVYVCLNAAGIPQWPAAIAGFATAVVLRGGAIQFGWQLPAYAGGSDKTGKGEN
ncbi:trimeric intracellular cation channel family protein [Rhizobiales bacterium]|uniref:trimeric intracellular cation channel family protein n=1 Tax=Hongsoonwoonella zoysiae TaxID=2821844 RepID=UPI0015615493|nr:trimeric intracellular cation channel family protein [Hongsoonwoonella zoysiae]NRG16466.1 trimeric intracellular cation channel family protein [Hongsoonwoonella zoysiae]